MELSNYANNVQTQQAHRCQVCGVATKNIYVYSIDGHQFEFCSKGCIEKGVENYKKNIEIIKKQELLHEGEDE